MDALAAIRAFVKVPRRVAAPLLLVPVWCALLAAWVLLHMFVFPRHPHSIPVVAIVVVWDICAFLLIPAALGAASLKLVGTRLQWSPLSVIVVDYLLIAAFLWTAYRLTAGITPDPGYSGLLLRAIPPTGLAALLMFPGRPARKSGPLHEPAK